MGESWFYRESVEAAERGPVSKSDIQYLQSQGTIQAGMQIRSEFGEWSAVTKSPLASAGSPDNRPAARPRVDTSVKADKPSTATMRPPAAVPKTVKPDHRTRNILAAAGTIAGVLVLILMQLQISSTGLEIDPSDDVVHSKGGQQTSLEQAFAENAAAAKDQDATVTTVTASAEGEAAFDADGSSAGTSDAPPPPVGPSAVVSGSQPAPLDRNIKQSHVLSPGAEFFGVRAAGRRFVFLIDASSSMLDGKDVAARRELIESVQRMTANMELEVIFFTHTVTRVFGRYESLQDRKRIVRKIEKANPPTGGTPVMPALRKSIDMQPDAIFLLTDGVFQEGDISGQVKTINTDGIPINTIAFVNRSAESVLKRVASDSGGDYRYVAR